MVYATSPSIIYIIPYLNIFNPSSFKSKSTWKAGTFKLNVKKHHHYCFYSFITDGNSGFHISLLRLLLQRKCETFPTFPRRSLWRNAATSPTHLCAAVGAPSAHLVAKLGSFYCRAAGNRPGNRNNQCLEQKQEWFFIASLCMKKFTPQQCYALDRSSPHYSGQSLSSWYDRIANAIPLGGFI